MITRRGGVDSNPWDQQAKGGTEISSENCWVLFSPVWEISISVYFGAQEFSETDYFFIYGRFGENFLGINNNVLSTTHTFEEFHRKMSCTCLRF
jgi:hypothetical protein